MGPEQEHRAMRSLILPSPPSISNNEREGMGIETNKQTHTISTRWLWISHRMQRWEYSCRIVFLEALYKGQKHPRWDVYISTCTVGKLSLSSVTCKQY